MNQILIREPAPGDLAAIAALSAQLGYPVSTSELATRIETVRSSADSRLVVAELQGEVKAWCHAHCVRLIESEGYAELGGIVVEEHDRKRGLGSALIEDIEAWVISRGFTRLRAYSGPQRPTAHDFYRHLGFAQSEPAMFQKTL